ncbi:MAG: signal recognition particle-docking protein FtsY [Kineosporiaceae bacterium]
MQEFLSDPSAIALAAAGLVAGIGAGLALVLGRSAGRRRAGDRDVPRPGVDYRPGVGDDAEDPRDTPVRTIETVDLPVPAPGATVETGAETDAAPATATTPGREAPAPARGRLARLRGRLARSESAVGRRLLALLGRQRVDEATWEEIEEVLLGADLGTVTTLGLVERLRTRHATDGGGDVRALLREELLRVLDPGRDRTLGVARHDGLPGVLLVVGVNGSGKTTTVGKIARLLVAEDKEVLLAAADTFRAAAADQLQSWGERVGVATVRSGEGADPASVAHDAVRAGVEGEVDVVVVDTAGRLQNKRGLMDELGKVKRVIERQAPVTETLLVLDATTGQNGLVQAQVFGEVVDVTGVALTKLDGTARGGIVVAVEQQLGVPVKLVGLGEGPDDLAPFEPEVFVDGLLGGATSDATA